MIRIYRALLTADLRLASQYRAQWALYVLFSFIRPVVFLAAWAAVATAQGGSVAGYTAGDFAAYYIALCVVTHLTQSWDYYEFEMEVRQGGLSAKLLRPLHRIHSAITGNLVWKLTSFPILVPVLLLIGWTFGATFRTTAVDLLLFVPSVILAAALKFLAGWCVASLAFWMTRVHAASTLFERAAFIFAGQIAPLSLMPGVFQVLAYALPFGYMLGVPAEILRGGMDPATALLLMAGQAAWLLVALVLFQAVWRAGLRAYSAVGA